MYAAGRVYSRARLAQCTIEHRGLLSWSMGRESFRAKAWGNPKGRADTLYSSQGDPGVRQANQLCTCAGNCSEHPGLTVVHRSPLACDPLPQDGHTAPALAQQGPFLGSGGLCWGQDTLLLESMQLFVEMSTCYVGPGQNSLWRRGRE